MYTKYYSDFAPINFVELINDFTLKLLHDDTSIFFLNTERHYKCLLYL